MKKRCVLIRKCRAKTHKPPSVPYRDDYEKRGCHLQTNFCFLIVNIHYKVVVLTGGICASVHLIQVGLFDQEIFTPLKNKPARSKPPAAGLALCGSVCGSAHTHICRIIVPRMPSVSASVYPCVCVRL